MSEKTRQPSLKQLYAQSELCLEYFDAKEKGEPFTVQMKEWDNSDDMYSDSPNPSFSAFYEYRRKPEKPKRKFVNLYKNKTTKKVYVGANIFESIDESAQDKLETLDHYGVWELFPVDLAKAIREYFILFVDCDGFARSDTGYFIAKEIKQMLKEIE